MYVEIINQSIYYFQLPKINDLKIFSQFDKKKKIANI